MTWPTDFRFYSSEWRNKTAFK